MRVTAVRVSVVIPTYNRADFVREAIVSVLQQDHLGRRTHRRGRRLGATAPRQSSTNLRRPAQYLWQENSGVSAARNRGVAASTGDLIAFLDSDDLWLPHKVSAQVAYFEAHPEVQGCHTDEIWIRRGGAGE